MKLTGSEKQIKWANDIIDRLTKTIDMNLERAKKYQMEDYITAWETVKTQFEKDIIPNLLNQENNAAYIIENRKKLDPQVVIDAANYIREQNAKKN